MRFTLSRTGLEALPESVFAKEILLEVDWVKDQGHGLLAAFSARYRSQAHYVALSEFSLVLRKGRRPNTFMNLPEGEGALWRTGRTTIIVDLDEMLRSIAVRALHATISDFALISGALEHERSILDGRALKWNPRKGGFFSPDETRDDLQAARIEAADVIGRAHFENPIAPQRFKFILPLMKARARNNQTPVDEELRLAKSKNLIEVSRAVVSKEVTRTTAHIAASAPRPLPAWATEFQEFRERLLELLRSPLNDAISQDFAEGEEWDPLVKARHVELERQAAIEAEATTLEADPLSDPVPSIDRVLENAFGKELVNRAHWTAMERRIMAASVELEEGETLADWARRNGLSPATVRVHRMNAKSKLEAAKKLT